MTNQQLFDKVATHLLTQRKAAIGKNGDCFYRKARRKGAAPLTCAIGCLIPEEKYRPEMEGTSLTNFGDISSSTATRIEMIRRAAGLSRKQIPLGRALQNLHDAMPVKGWREGLRRIATHFNLKPTVLEATHV